MVLPLAEPVCNRRSIPFSFRPVKETCERLFVVFVVDIENRKTKRFSAVLIRLLFMCIHRRSCLRSHLSTYNGNLHLSLALDLSYLGDLTYAFDLACLGDLTP